MRFDSPRLHFTLQAKIFGILAVLVLINLTGAATALWYAARPTAPLADPDALGSAGELHVSLALRHAAIMAVYSGLASPAELPAFNAAVDDSLRRARASAVVQGARELLNSIESDNLRYLYAMERYRELDSRADAASLAEVRQEAERYFGAMDGSCREYLRQQGLYMQAFRHTAREFRRVVILLSASAILCSLGLGIYLRSVLVRQVFGPIRQMVRTDEDDHAIGQVGDEVKALSTWVQGLINAVDGAQSKLRQSREHLIQSEKLAVTGKLAASVAHSIRNPLTAVKMRLFSLERTLTLTPTQREDLEVISEEIRHIDTIVRNFLEYSRRPKLQTQPMSPSDVVDMTLQLLHHRLESSGVAITLFRERKLPECALDPDQIKEVLVNIILNACEAMVHGGRIEIHEQPGVMDPHGHVSIIQVRDDGPGIPAEIIDQVFQPFFTTKGEGTGLGLSIAHRIMEEHGGWVHCRSDKGGAWGATFVLGLPCKEKTTWLQS